MTPSQWYDQNEGKSILIPGGGSGNNGQCEQAVDSFIHDVFGLPYTYTPNAIDFWNNYNSLPTLNQYFDQIPAGQPLKEDDILVYDQRVGSPSGHVDINRDDAPNLSIYTAYDSNWGNVNDPTTGYPVLHTVLHNDKYNNYVLGYLRRKGQTMPFFANDTERDDLINGLNTGLYGPLSSDRLNSTLINQRPAFDADPKSALFAVIGNAAKASDSLQAQLNYANERIAQLEANTTQLKPGNYNVAG